MKIETDVKSFDAAFRELRETVRKDLGTALKQQAKLFVRDIINLMKPESGPAGRKRVARDIARVFRVQGSNLSEHELRSVTKGSTPEIVARQLISNKTLGSQFAARFKNERIKKRISELVTSGNEDSLRAVLEGRGRSGTRKRDDKGRWTKVNKGKSNPIIKGTDGRKSDTPSKTIHDAAKFKGVVPPSARGRSVAYTGRMAAIRAYIKSVQERVGSAKGGWGEAARMLGAILPEFVSRNSTGRGSATIDDTPDKYTITLINRDPAAVQQDKQFKISDRAFDMRVISMETQVQKILEARARKASETK